MEQLFRKYLPPHAKIADLGCGRADALVLASLCVEDCELWGLDMDAAGLADGRRRLPQAKLFEGDMHNPASLPHEYFDVVHEFGAAFLSRGWDVLARSYFSLLRDDGILLWELPQRWSLAHIAYLLNLAPKNSPGESKLRRMFRSLLPGKYRFESDASVAHALQNAGCDYEIVEKVRIWCFFCPKFLQPALNWAWQYLGDDLFDRLEKVTRWVWPKDAGYYLVVRKKGPSKLTGSVA